jgi:uncharacterized damage-inducible protein DinB
MGLKLTDQFLAELDVEAAATRRVLERVPEGRDDWKPHPKSMPMGRLTQLVAEMPGWVAMTIDRDELDVMSGDGSTSPMLTTTLEGIEALDNGVAAARDALARTTDEHLMTNWRMLAKGTLVSEQPRYLVLRHSVFNHLAHHRGQLTVYLRLNDEPVPSVYGPTADDSRFA